MTRHKETKKRNLHIANEYFEFIYNEVSTVSAKQELDIKAEVHNIAILNNIFLTFQS